MDINTTTPKADPNDAKALLPDGKPRWSSNTITYNFMPSLPAIYNYIEEAKIVTDLADGQIPNFKSFGFKPFVEAQKLAAEAALQQWADVANFRFEQKEDKALQLADFLTPPEIKIILNAVGKYDDFANAVDRSAGKYLGFPVVEGADIRFGTGDQGNVSAGFAIYPPENVFERVEEAKNNFFDEVDRIIKPINDAIDKLNDANLINRIPGVEVNLIPKLPTASKLFPFGTLKLGIYGDVFLNNKAETNQPDKIGLRGGYGFNTLIHEIGHALGLEHPGNYNAGGGGTDAPYLSKDKDSDRYTIMSYTNAFSGVYPTTPMLYDIVAIQSLYGANFKTRSGDTSYSWSKPFAETIWDGGGNDTITASNWKKPVKINLNAGEFSSIGLENNLAIAFGVTIENAIGSAYDDQIVGNEVHNYLKGGKGNDTLKGGEGYDFLEGGSENDFLYGEAGADTLSGGEGNDRLEGGSENDFLYGEAGADALKGGTGNDLLEGGTGNDLLEGGTGADTMYGQDGDDIYIVDNVGDLVIEYDSDGRDTGGNDGVKSSVDFDLRTTRFVEVLTLTGTATRGIGNQLDNTIFGNDKDNWLEGGDGNDTLEGGTGDDIYIVDSTGDVIIDSPGTGIETVRSSVSWTVGAGLDHLTLTGSDTINGTGNAINNIITGNSAANILDGSIGNDTLIGGAGDDTYIVDSINDVVQELLNEGTDTVRTALAWTLGDNLENLVLLGTTAINGTGNALNNIITGNNAANILDGRGGDDTLIGGNGDDTYIVDSIGDVIIDSPGTGIETVKSSVSWSLGAGLDHLALTGTAIYGIGNALNNRITGNSAANVLDGGVGNDTLEGGDGDDLYIVDNVNDVIIDSPGTGTETVWSSVSGTLGLGLDNLTLTGTIAIDGTGNSLSNIIIGNSARNRLIGAAGNDALDGGDDNDYLNGGDGDDVLDGGSGNDTLEGGIGDDIYIVDSAGDVIIDSSGTGIETVKSSVSWALGAGLDHLTLTGIEAINGTGNALTNIIIGNSNNNVLNGGLGNDTLTGGSGADSFVFDTGTQFTSAIGIDRITDFTVSIDKIILDKTTFTALASAPGGTLNQNEFAIINSTTNGASLAGASIAPIVFNQFNGDLFYNPDGNFNGLGSGGQFATLVGVTTLTANSFVIQA